jgi:4-hydroxyproline epimerase
MPSPSAIVVIDSHTGGEPTRVVIDGGPALPADLSVRDRVQLLRDQYDSFRAGVVLEPRGSDIVVGALLCPPLDPACTAGVIFFNNAGYLGMCGHGTIGLLVTLHYLNRIGLGIHSIETPVGVITATLHDRHRVTVRNVPSFRHAAGVSVDVAGLGRVTGDVAWGGNWFFLAREHREELNLANVERLTDVAWRIRQALHQAHVTGKGGQEIDHIELFGPSNIADSKNFVLCPGKAYDRSPCGTGTSAKMACLAADGKLLQGQVYRQEGIVGSVFEGSVEVAGGAVVPSITGTAYVTGESTLVFEDGDPYHAGIGAICGNR